MSTDNTLSNTLSTLIQTLTDLKAALDRPQLEKAPDLSEYVKLDDLHDEVRDAMHDYISNNFDPSDHDVATRDYVDSTVDEKLDEKLDVAEITNAIKANMGDAVRQIVREELRKILTKGLDE